jgi:hypothetical protein
MAESNPQEPVFWFGLSFVERERIASRAIICTYNVNASGRQVKNDKNGAALRERGSFWPF